MKIDRIVKDIVSQSLKILKKYDLEKENLTLDYVDIFPKNKKEYDSLSKQMQGEEVFRTSTGITYKLAKPIKTPKGKLTLLRVRKYDPTRKAFRGHPDYAAKNYRKLKKKLLVKDNVNLIKRENYEMLEIWDKDFKVLVYFPDKPLSEDIGI